jgi:hypothetical protein
MRTLWCLSLVILVAPEAWAQRYELVEPSGLVSGTVDAVRGRLVVYERSGERVHFSREARYDSADGRLLGYFNFELNRVLRFPKSGTGVMQTANLQDAAPRFQNTLRIARPVGVVPAGNVLVGPGRDDTEPSSRAIAGIRPGRYSGDRFAPIYVDPYVSRYRGAGPLAQSVLIDSKTVPNPPLPPARVSFRNDGPREIQVAVVDLKNPSGTRSMRIRPAEVVDVQLTRDAGAKRVAHYRVVTLSGETITKRIQTEVQPTYRYEVVVHQWEMQSIAIDRTGKSPNRIEDINFQGLGLGRFPLPPGPQLNSGTIDVYRAARGRGNEGTISPIFPRDELRADSASPLERAVLELQRAAQGR